MSRTRKGVGNPRPRPVVIGRHMSFPNGFPDVSEELVFREPPRRADDDDDRDNEDDVHVVTSFPVGTTYFSMAYLWVFSISIANVVSDLSTVDRSVGRTW